MFIVFIESLDSYGRRSSYEGTVLECGKSIERYNRMKTFTITAPDVPMIGTGQISDMVFGMQLGGKKRDIIAQITMIPAPTREAYVKIDEETGLPYWHFDAFAAAPKKINIIS